MLHLLHVARAHLSAYTFHVVFNLHCTRVLEDERPLDMITFAQRMFEIDKHGVRAARLELNRLPRLDVDPAEFTHFRNAVFHDHRVELKMIRNINRSPNKPIRCGAIVLDGHIADASLSALRGSARPRAANR